MATRLFHLQGCQNLNRCPLPPPPPPRTKYEYLCTVRRALPGGESEIVCTVLSTIWRDSDTSCSSGLKGFRDVADMRLPCCRQVMRRKAVGSQTLLSHHQENLWVSYKPLTKPDKDLLDRSESRQSLPLVLGRTCSDFLRQCRMSFMLCSSVLGLSAVFVSLYLPLSSCTVVQHNFDEAPASNWQNSTSGQEPVSVVDSKPIGLLLWGPSAAIHMKCND